MYDQVRSLETGKTWAFTIPEMSKFVRAWRELVKISKSLQRSHENDCNYGLSKRQETREENLVKKAEEIAREIGFSVYEQGDPRGCALYLIPLNMENPEQYYTDGLAIF